MEKTNMPLVKKHLLFWFPMMFLLVISTAVNAAPYLGADIAKKGSEFSSISVDQPWNIGDPEITAYGTGWGAPPAWAWVEYTAYLIPGNWNIGLNVMNAWYSGVTVPPGYSFSITYTGGINPLVIPGSDTEIMNGFFNVNISSAGDYTCRFTWLNDQNDPKNGYDANLMIMSVFADNTATAPVPEPATMLLLGSGLVGLAGYGRKKFFKK